MTFPSKFKRRLDFEQYEKYHKSNGRVLSIQSHTVYGYVGNKSAVFPMQILGLDVDPINSVQFSNNTGYPTFKGQILDGDQLSELITGLEANSLLTYSHLLTGYVGSESFLQSILVTLEKLRHHNPDIIYVCDPVMGDNGKLYVCEELVQVYKTKVIPQATILTPNQFESELLTGIKIRSLQEAIEACKILHSRGPEIVVITSLTLETHPGEIVLLGSQSINGKVNQFIVTAPRLPGSYTGTGDLIAALLLAWHHKFEYDLSYILENALGSIQAVLKRTLHEAGQGAELRLIQSMEDIRCPKINSRACLLDASIQGIIFDMDGTLTIPHALDFLPVYDKFSLSLEDDLLESINNLPFPMNKQAMEMVESEEARGSSQLEIQPGVSEVIRKLHQRGIPIGIATRNSMRSVTTFLEVAKLPKELFTAIITRDYDFVKPHPGVARDICTTFNFHPSNVLFVGDTVHDTLCGQFAGCQIALLLNEKNHHLLPFVDVSLKTLDDIENLLG